MNKQEARSLFLDYLYGEIEEKKSKELEAYLRDHSDLREELQELQETRSILHKIPLKQPTHQLLVVKPEAGRLRQWWRDVKQLIIPESLWRRSGLAIAAGGLLGVLLFSLANLQIEVQETGWSVSFGTRPAIQQGIDEETLNEILTLMRRETLLVASEVAETSRQEQEVRIQEATEFILEYIETQRRNDLQLIGEGLTQIEEESYYRHLITNEAFDDLLHTLSVQP